MEVKKIIALEYSDRELREYLTSMQDIIKVGEDMANRLCDSQDSHDHQLADKWDDALKLVKIYLDEIKNKI